MHSGIGGRWSKATRWALAWAAAVAGAHAAASPLLDACNSDGFARTLVAPPAAAVPLDARAVWLDAKSLRWPGAPMDGRFVLYRSAHSQVIAVPGATVRGADGAWPLHAAPAVPAEVARRFKYLASGPDLRLPFDDVPAVRRLHRAQLVLVRQDEQGRVIDATGVQSAGALDALYADAAAGAELGVAPGRQRSGFAVWAPTAVGAAVCVYPSAEGAATRAMPMRLNARSGVWSAQVPGDLSGRYYTYLIDVNVPGAGLVRNRVTDPYAVSLNADSRRSYVASLSSPALAPAGWGADRAPSTVRRPTDMVIYELHVRDFSVNDPSVPPAHRGKYLAFTDSASRGMRHLKALAAAGLTDVHLLPVFDFATVPETGCVTPHPEGGPDSESQQAAVVAVKDRDCFNWGYDPLHYGAPEGSYATDADDGAARVREFRRMVMALHRAGLRVGMDVVYNHTDASGQALHSVLDRIVPGYYQRLNARGAVETSTCCANTATENRMMGKLLIDTALRWARDYHVDSFRFDLMAHQPRAVMEALQARLKAATGRDIPLIGEGWNFGEVANGARFEQASQLSLNGSGIGTFNDRLRDAVRGGSAGDSGVAMVEHQGFINGLGYAPNARSKAGPAELRHAADLVRAGLAGSLRDFALPAAQGGALPLERLDYNGQPAGYASQPSEVVNYVENHDNQTLFDANVLKLPHDTSPEDRARVQVLGMALVAFAQGIPYFHAGIDTLRSKSLDRNSFDSGDWFNRLDWSYQDNNFGAGAPPKPDNGADYALLKPLLADPALKPSAREIAWTRDAFRDLLRIRASSMLFRLPTAQAVEQRLHFDNTGPQHAPTVIVGRLDGRGLDGARFDDVVYLVNVGVQAESVEVDALKGHRLKLHPVHTAPQAADQRALQARFDAASGRFTVPPRTAVVFVADDD